MPDDPPWLTDDEVRCDSLEALTARIRALRTMGAFRSDRPLWSDAQLRALPPGRAQVLIKAFLLADPTP